MDPTSDNDHDACASDEESFSGSESSTIVYSHEPYETYQFRVHKLLGALYGSEAAQTAEIARLKGGGYNRIISVVIATNNTEPTTQEELILRVPRFDADVARQVRLLRGLKPFLPVPEVVRYDASEANALGNPYILMLRLPGQPLNNVIQDMNSEDRCEMARQIAQLLTKIHGIPVPSSIGPLSVDDTGALSIDQLPEGPSHRGEDKTIDEEEQTLDLPVSTTLREFVTSRLAGHRAFSLRQEHINYFAIEESDRLLDASNVLLSALPESDSDRRLALFHHDFAPRNILVAQSTVDGHSSWAVMGLLDWDDCEAAPLAIARVWPGWLWAAADEDEADFDLNEWDPDLPVPNEECEKIKTAFVEEIEKWEPGYLNMVRITRDHCLRLLYERSRDGFWSTEHIKDVDRVVEVAQRVSQQANNSVPAI